MCLLSIFPFTLISSLWLLQFCFKDFGVLQIRITLKLIGKPDPYKRKGLQEWDAGRVLLRSSGVKIHPEPPFLYHLPRVINVYLGGEA